MTLYNNDIWGAIIGLDTIAREMLGLNTAGVSIGDYSSIILLDESPELVETANQILAGNNLLEVIANSSELVEGSGDIIITCSDTLITDDNTVGYAVVLDGGLYSKGSSNLTGAEVSLTLPDPVNGEYYIYIYRQAPPYESGFVKVIVTEA